MHRWSELFIPTLREAPADAGAASEKLLVRAGYIRQITAGTYAYLLLGQRSLNKITALIERQMDKIGQQLCLPIHCPQGKEEERRSFSNADQAFELRAGSQGNFQHGLIAEEQMMEIARKELRSYKQLPQIWYQIDTTFQDEPKARIGLLTSRQFRIVSSCSFDIDSTALEISYQKHSAAYRKILDTCGLTYVVAESTSPDSGSQSHQFMVRTTAGNEKLVACNSCSYTANIKSATSRIPPRDDLPAEGNGRPIHVYTPGLKTIEEVAEYLGIPAKNHIKTLAYTADLLDSKTAQPTPRPVIALLQGDHPLNEAKLSATIGGAPFRPMQAGQIDEVFGGSAGFLGPVGLNNVATLKGESFSPGVIVFADEALRGHENLIAGANRPDYHLKNVTPGRDFQPTAYIDLRAVAAGEKCPICDGVLSIDAAVELAHMTKLDERRSNTGILRVLGPDGKELSPALGNYRLAVERMLALAVEQNNDQNGFWLPAAIAPFQVIVTPINSVDKSLVSTALDLASRLADTGVDVLVDDRDERAGVKFKDADLIGIPYRINVGKKVTEGTIEVVPRSTLAKHDVSIAAIAEYMQQLLRP